MNRDFKGVWTPREIWLNRSISMQAKNLWAEIHSLHDREKGGCYASDEYLCQFLGLKRSRLHEVLKELKNEKLLETVSFDGRRTVRKALMPAIEQESKIEEVEIKEDELSGKPDSCDPHQLCYPENRTAEIRDPGFYPYIENKESSSKEEDREKDAKRVRPAAKAATRSPSSKKIKREKDVSCTEEEHRKLIEQFGEELTLRCYQRLSLWKSDTPRSKWKKSDYLAILRWVADAIKEEDKKKGKGEASQVEKDKELAEKIAKDFGEKTKIFLFKDCILFPGNAVCPAVQPEFGSKGFKQNCIEALQKRGIKV